MHTFTVYIPIYKAARPKCEGFILWEAGECPVNLMDLSQEMLLFLMRNDLHKGKRVTKVIMCHPLESKNIHIKCNDCLTSSCWDISLWAD